MASVPPLAGRLELRREIAARNRVQPEQVLVVSGAQQAIDLLARGLTERGDRVIIDTPTFAGAIHAFRTAGAVLIPWAVKNWDVDELENLILRHRPKLIYTNPTFQNPTGQTMSPRTRTKLLEVATRYRIPVIEDDPYRDLYFGAPPPSTLLELDREHVVIRIQTVSKILGAGVRLAWVIADEPVIEQLTYLKFGASASADNFGQLVLTEMLRADLIERQAAALRREHERRRDYFLDALARELPKGLLRANRPAGGMYFWGRLGNGYTARALQMAATAVGLTLVTGDSVNLEQSADEEVRLCFTPFGPPKIDEAVRRLASAFAWLQKAAAPAGAGTARLS